MDIALYCQTGRLYTQRWTGLDLTVSQDSLSGRKNVETATLSGGRVVTTPMILMMMVRVLRRQTLSIWRQHRRTRTFCRGGNRPSPIIFGCHSGHPMEPTKFNTTNVFNNINRIPPTHETPLQYAQNLTVRKTLNVLLIYNILHTSKTRQPLAVYTLGKMYDKNSTYALLNVSAGLYEVQHVSCCLFKPCDVQSANLAR